MVNTPATASGRMFPAPSHRTPERTSAPSSKKSSKSANQRRPRCLRLIKDDGHTRTSYWETDGAWHTELSMRNTGEGPSSTEIAAMYSRWGHHSVAVESTLSQILQDRAPEKYFLSPRACLGILRRSEKRGKVLPPMLKEALEQQIKSHTP